MTPPCCYAVLTENSKTKKVRIEVHFVEYLPAEMVAFIVSAGISSSIEIVLQQRALQK